MRNFEKRRGIHSVVRHGEGASSDKVGAERFVRDFKDFVDTVLMDIFHNKCLIVRRHGYSGKNCRRGHTLPKRRRHCPDTS